MFKDNDLLPSNAKFIVTLCGLLSIKTGQGTERDKMVSSKKHYI